MSFYLTPFNEGGHFCPPLFYYLQHESNHHAEIVALLNHGTFRSATHLAENKDLRHSRQQQETAKAFLVTSKFETDCS